MSLVGFSVNKAAERLAGIIYMYLQLSFGFTTYCSTLGRITYLVGGYDKITNHPIRKFKVRLVQAVDTSDYNFLEPGEGYCLFEVIDELDKDLEVSPFTLYRHLNTNYTYIYIPQSGIVDALCLLDPQGTQFRSFNTMGRSITHLNKLVIAWYQYTEIEVQYEEAMKQRRVHKASKKKAKKVRQKKRKQDALLNQSASKKKHKGDDEQVMYFSFASAFLSYLTCILLWLLVIRSPRKNTTKTGCIKNRR
jgi:hypothetical protein